MITILVYIFYANLLYSKVCYPDQKINDAGHKRRNRLRLTAYGSPLTAYRLRLTAYGSPLTAYLSG
ncbi:MAG: hypothetical protein IPK46_14630 [Saprospiraceae bacterium]|nr:hypothetical protein [Saprospiraceae bacterium]